MAMKHPFVVGTAVGAGGLILWYRRAWFLGLFRRIGHAFSGAPDALVSSLPTTGDAAAATCARQIRRYAFAASQDRSPIVGLTHASYALILLDTLEELAGRDKIKASGIDPVKVRAFITAQQDRHAKMLESCDPFLTGVLALERGESSVPSSFVFAGGAPTGA